MRRTILTIVASFLAVLTVVAIVFFNPALLITPAILGVTQKYLKTMNTDFDTFISFVKKTNYKFIPVD